MAVTIPNQTGTLASSTTTTAGAVPVTRYGVAVPGFGGGTDSAAFWAPDAALNAASVTVVIAAHGAGGSHTFADATTGPQGLMRQNLLDAGYCVLAPNMHGDTFGNQTAQSDVAAAWRWLTSIVGWDVANLVLWGESMGGGAITAAYALGSVPKDRVACTFLAAPLLNYTYMPASPDPALIAAMNTAYGATDDASRSANSHDFDPMRRPVADYAGLRVWISSSAADPTVIRDQNALAFLAKITGTAVSGTDYPTTGGHVSAQHYAYTDITTFVASSLTAETAQADNVPYVPGGAGPSGYTPQSVTGLIRWSRADDYAATGDGAQFTSGSVSDRANAGTSWAPGTAGSGPTYWASVAALGGQPALEFDGLYTDAVAELGTTTALSATNGFTVWAVHARAATGGGTAPALVSQDTIANPNRVFQLGFSTTTPSQGRMVAFVNSTATARTDPGATLAAKTTPAVFTGTADPTMTELWSNGASAGATTTPTGLYTIARRVIVGASESNNTTYPFAGHIAEWGIYDHVLTATERGRLHSYVQDRYGTAAITVADYSTAAAALTATRSDAAAASDAVTATFTPGATGLTATPADVAGATDGRTVVSTAVRAAADVAAATDAVTATLTPGASIALVSSASADSGATAVTSMAIAGPPAPATFAVIFVGRSGGLSTGALSGVSDTAGNTWQLATRGAVSGATSTRLEVWFCEGYTPATTVTATSSASQTSGWLIAGFTGVVGATSLDVASPDNSAAAAGGTISTPSITTTARDLLLAADQHGGGTTGSGPAAPWTALGGWNVSTAGAGNAGYLLADTPGSYSATFTQGGTGAAGVAIAAFRVAQAAPTGTNYTATPADAAGGVDAASAVQSIIEVAADSGAAVDTGAATQALVRTPADAAGAVDTVTAQLSSAVAGAADVAGATDAASAVVTAAQTAADVAAAADVVTSVLAPPTASLVETFDAQNSEWIGYSADVAVGSGYLSIQPRTSYPRLETTKVRALRGSTFTGELLQLATTSGTSASTSLVFRIDTTNLIELSVSPTSATPLGGRFTVAGAANDLYFAAVAGATHYRIEVTTGGQILWRAYASGAWTTFRTATLPAAWGEVLGTMRVTAGFFTGTETTGQPARWGSVNLDPAASVAYTPTAADAADSVDAATATQTAVRTPADAAGAIDSVTVSSSAAGAQTVADAAGAIDVVSAVQAITKPAADVAAGTDTATQAVGVARTAGDAAGAADSVTVVQSITEPAADVADAVDAATATLTGAAQYADTAAGVDAWSATITAARTPADTAAGVDAVTTSTAGTQAAADSAGAADAATAVQAIAEPVADVAAAVDAITVTLSGSGQYTDLAAAVDAVTAVTTADRAVADVAAGVDAIGAALGTAKAVGDASAAVDTAAATQAQQAASADVAGAVDSVDMFFAGLSQLGVADAAAAADAAITTQTGQRAMADAAAAVDGVSWVMTRLVVIADAADVADAFATAASVKVTRGDTAGAVDVVLPRFDLAALIRYDWRLRYGRVGGQLRATTIGGTLRGRD